MMLAWYFTSKTAQITKNNVKDAPAFCQPNIDREYMLVKSNHKMQSIFISGLLSNSTPWRQ